MSSSDAIRDDECLGGDDGDGGCGSNEIEENLDRLMLAILRHLRNELNQHWNETKRLRVMFDHLRRHQNDDGASVYGHGDDGG